MGMRPLVLFSVIMAIGACAESSRVTVDSPLSRRELAAAFDPAFDMAALRRDDGTFAAEPEVRFPVNGTTQTYLIDVSHYNKAIDWAMVAKSGIGHAYAKATHGTTLTDETFFDHAEQASRHGVAIGAYHFLSSSSAVTDQAAHYLATIGPYDDHLSLPPVLDMEWDVARGSTKDQWESYTPEAIVEIAKSWLETVEKATGRRPIIYTNKSWWDARIGTVGAGLSRYPLWIANYDAEGKAGPPVPDGFVWALWQYSEKASVPGIEGLVDASVLTPTFSAGLETRSADPR